MKAVQVVTPTGPADVEVREVDPPVPGHNDVLVEVHSVGVSFPDLLLSRGEYQFKPEPPFPLGVDFAGVVLDPGQYAGCYYPRFIANTTTLSNHSFGLALDLNTAGNQRGTVGEIDRDVVAIFKTWGFAWGGDWRWTDPMHFELSEVKAVG